MNRDDQAGFRLDTLSTHHQYSTPTVRGKDILSTHTDYVNRYPSVLQTTSYNFTGSSTTTELCAGVTKAQPMHSKNAAQHFSDINMLSKQEVLRNAFYNTETGKPKLIDCIRVDGAGDEGPGHEEVQYYWTRWHLEQEKLVTLVTTRSSGSSYMNRVELQNGCLTRAHSSLFIPSTIHGSCIAESGKVDEEILRRNLDTAIDIYIDRCDGCSCGRTQIHLFKGTSSDQQEREKLRIFLKGPKKERERLQKEDPQLFSHFNDVWTVKTLHMVPNLPQQYIFFLKCCFREDCIHPICKRGSHNVIHWYSGGPLLSFLPLPVSDPARPWGDDNCSTCKGTCSGHYLKPESNLVNLQSSVSCAVSSTPSTVIAATLKSCRGTMPDDQMKELARKVLLPTEEVRWYIEHLETVQENRKKGARKAAETRARKKQQKSQGDCENSIKCGVCSKDWQVETEEVEDWIQCEKCEKWYHWQCQNIFGSVAPEEFVCTKCQN